ncbi:MAG TPA: glycosyltransferase family 4 protein [Candidatus Limnocylindria bacterium]
MPVQLVLPADPERMRIGGIASFVRGFAKFAPDDLDLSMIGISATRTAWRWHDVELEGRPLRLLPVVADDGTRRSRVPIAARFVAAIARRRREAAAGRWVRSFHRPATDLPFDTDAGPMWRVVHLSVSDLTTAGSESRWRPLAGLLRASERRSFRRMRRIFVVNRAAADRYRAEFPEAADRIGFVPNWFDPTIFRPAAADDRQRQRALLAGRFDLLGDGPLLLYAGRLEGQKDPVLLARAFAVLHRADPAARLLVAGEGGQLPAMRDELRRLGVADAARFAGTVPREELAGLMHAADALVISSAFETGPTIGLEALACGLPVVTTDVGEVAGVVARSGAGAVAGARTPEALGEVLRRVTAEAESLRERAAAAAAPFAADRVLGELYEENRRLAALLPVGAS